MGGLHKCSHLLDELRAPLLISQEEVGRDLARFVHGFPMDAIPYETDNEKTIKRSRRDITHLRVEILQLDRERAADRLDSAEHLRRRTALTLKEAFWERQLKQASEMHRMERLANRANQKK